MCSLSLLPDHQIDPMYWFPVQDGVSLVPVYLLAVVEAVDEHDDAQAAVRHT